MGRLARWIKKDSRAMVLLFSVFGLLLPAGALLLGRLGIVWLDYIAPLLLLSMVLSSAFVLGWLMSAGVVQRAWARLKFLAGYYWYLSLAVFLALGAGAGYLLVRVCDPGLIHPLHVYDYFGILFMFASIWLIGFLIKVLRGPA